MLSFYSVLSLFFLSVWKPNVNHSSPAAFKCHQCLVPFWKFLHHSWNRTWVNKDSYAHRKPFTHCASLWNWWWSLVEITRSILSSKPLPYLPLGLMTNMTFDTFTGSPFSHLLQVEKSLSQVPPTFALPNMYILWSLVTTVQQITSGVDTV